MANQEKTPSHKNNVPEQVAEGLIEGPIENIVSGAGDIAEKPVESILEGMENIINLMFEAFAPSSGAKNKDQKDYRDQKEPQRQKRRDYKKIVKKSK